MASWVLNHYSLRLCTALVAIPIGLSFLVTSFARNVNEVIAAFSIPFGFTSCMLFMIAFKSLQIYFDKRLITANGKSLNQWLLTLLEVQSPTSSVHTIMQPKIFLFFKFKASI